MKPLNRFMIIFILVSPIKTNVWSQLTTIQRDTSYTLARALQKAQKNNKEDDIHITAVYSKPSKHILTEKEVVYKKSAHRELTANFFYPRKNNKTKRPAILIIHGGGWRSGDKALMTPMAERLAEAGYFVMAPEYRLSMEATYPAAMMDLYDALRWMLDHAGEYNIDTEKFIAMGCSAGGQLAALVGTTYNQPVNSYHQHTPGHIAAIIDVDGVLAFKHPDSQEGKVAGEWLGGTYEEVPDIWEEAAALNHVDGYTPPTLFLASIHLRFLAGRQDYIAKLQAFGTASETHFLDRAPHSFWLFNPWFDPTLDYIKAFLKTHLPL